MPSTRERGRASAARFQSLSGAAADRVSRSWLPLLRSGLRTQESARTKQPFRNRFRSDRQLWGRIWGLCNPMQTAPIFQPVRSQGWRRGRDSNPRRHCEHDAFRVRCVRPPCHFSAVLLRDGSAGQSLRCPFLFFEFGRQESTTACSHLFDEYLTLPANSGLSACKDWRSLGKRACEANSGTYPTVWGEGASLIHKEFSEPAPNDRAETGTAAQGVKALNGGMKMGGSSRSEYYRTDRCRATDWIGGAA